MPTLSAGADLRTFAAVAGFSLADAVQYVTQRGLFTSKELQWKFQFIAARPGEEHDVTRTMPAVHLAVQQAFLHSQVSRLPDRTWLHAG